MESSKQVVLKNLEEEFKAQLERNRGLSEEYEGIQNRSKTGTHDHMFGKVMRNYHDGKVHAYQHVLNLIEDELVFAKVFAKG